mmetsp:Transcript_96177/g.210464  ORF Transcript_96177/g.210464 Transcript_96177/m.210464 type:complete len:221 (-) Transcript_96177:135-797(-)
MKGSDADTSRKASVCLIALIVEETSGPAPGRAGEAWGHIGARWAIWQQPLSASKYKSGSLLLLLLLLAPPSCKSAESSATEKVPCPADPHRVTPSKCLPQGLGSIVKRPLDRHLGKKGSSKIGWGSPEGTPTSPSPACSMRCLPELAKGARNKSASCTHAVAGSIGGCCRERCENGLTADRVADEAAGRGGRYPDLARFRAASGTYSSALSAWMPPAMST